MLFTVRHPASWLVSLFKHPYQRLGRRSRTLAEFIDSKWETAGRGRLGHRSFRPLDLLQVKLDSYFRFANKLSEHDIAHRLLRFEDIVLDQAAVFHSIAPELEGARSDFEELRASTKDASKTLEDYRDYYANERWRDDLRGIEASIDDAIDWTRFERFGYQPLSASTSLTRGAR